jgi:putative ABC transport system ATP-binding protein
MAMSFEVRGVNYSYRPGVPVLNGVDVAIPEGATTVVLGDSGSGKSTLLYLLGLLWEEASPGAGPKGATRRPRAVRNGQGQFDGQIIYHGGGAPQDYQRLSPSEAAALRRSDFGFVLQSSYMLPNFTCAQNAAMPLALRGDRHAESLPALRQLVAALDDDDRGLVEAMTQPAVAVSGGQRQRFAVVRAIVHDPQVVFADEPFSNLDEKHPERTLDLLRDWRRGETPCSPQRRRPRTLILVCAPRRDAVLDPAAAAADADPGLP